MKTFALVLLSLAIIGGAFYTGKYSAAQERFQLSNGSKDVFRFDRKTGQAWVMVQDPKTYEGHWEAIKNP